MAKLKLAIELSDSTLATDLGPKAKLYAAHGVPEYWVVDRDGQRIIQMWDPQPTGFQSRAEVRLGADIASVTLARLVATTSGLI